MNRISKNILMFVLMHVVSVYSTIEYKFGYVRVKDASLNVIEAYNPRYVDKSLIVVHDLVDDLDGCVWYGKFPAQGFIYGVYLPILRLAEFYEYPQYATFSRLITNPTVLIVSLLVGSYVYHDEEDNDVQDESNIVHQSDNDQKEAAV